MNKREVINKAENFCYQNGIDEYPVKIVSICQKYGFSVYEKYLPTDVSGYVVDQEDPFLDFNTGKVIVANLYDSARRRRFTIAHELAHAILHKEEGSALFAHRDAGQTGPLEVEANTFAAVILMPEELVRLALKKLEQNYAQYISPETKVRYIAAAFAVSVDAAAVRLNHLDLL